MRWTGWVAALALGATLACSSGEPLPDDQPRPDDVDENGRGPGGGPGDGGGGSTDAGILDAGTQTRDGGIADGGNGTFDGGTGTHDGGIPSDGGTTCQEGWSAQAPLQEPRAGAFATALPDGRVFAAGGFDPSWSKTARQSVEIFEVTSGQWSTGPAMNAERAGIVALQLRSSDVFAIWGSTSVSSGKAVGPPELYSPGTGTWTTVAPLDPRIRMVFAAEELGDGRVLVLGSTFSEDGVLAQLFDRATGTWTLTTRAPHDYDSELYATGSGGAALIGPTHVDEWSPATGQWTQRAEIPPSFAYNVSSASLAPGRVLVWGGQDGTSAILDLATMTWTDGPALAGGWPVASTPQGVVINTGNGLVLVRPDGTLRSLPAQPADLEYTDSGAVIAGGRLIALGRSTSAILRICH